MIRSTSAGSSGKTPYRSRTGLKIGVELLGEIGLVRNAAERARTAFRGNAVELERVDEPP